MKRIVRSRIFETIIVTAYISLSFGCDNGPDVPTTSLPQQPDSLGCTIQKVFPHDTSSFTEGLLIYKGALYESAGDYGKSKLLKIDLNTGKIEKQLDLDPKYFGEGIVILHDTIYQLTYKEKAVFVYTMDFKKVNQYSITTDNGQGWGMTTDGASLIVDDGSSNLYFYEPSTFKLIKKLPVTDADTPGYNLNELEYIDGYIYANQWQLPYILKIDPSNGKVVAKIDLTDIWHRLQQKAPKAEVLNGIAYDVETKKIYITGKHWPELYTVRFK